MPAATILQWFWSLKNQSLSLFPLFSHLFAMLMGPDAMILVFWMLSFKPTFPLFSFTFIRRLFRFFANWATEACRLEPSEISKQIWKISSWSPRRREGESVSSVATLYYLKCQIFKKNYKTQKTMIHILEKIRQQKLPVRGTRYWIWRQGIKAANINIFKEQKELYLKK